VTGVHVRPASRSTAERRPVVVGVDGSDSARHAADWAADVAAAWGVPLRLLHATPGPGPREDGDPRWLRELCDAAERAGVEEVDRRIVTGPVADELIEQSRAAAMVVVGSYGEGARSGMLAGSTALALVDGGGCPVAVIRGTAPQVPPPRRGPVVVGMDTGGDVTALHTGAKLADALGTRLCVLHAWSDVTEQGQGVHRSTASGTELAARAVELLNARVARCSRRIPPWRSNGTSWTTPPCVRCWATPPPPGSSSSVTAAEGVQGDGSAPPAGGWWGSHRAPSSSRGVGRD